MNSSFETLMDVVRTINAAAGITVALLLFAYIMEATKGDDDDPDGWA